MIQIYDTTLRDGTQREGISLSCDDKLRIARRLDELGVSFIEGGWPGSNPKDAEFFDRARDVPWQHAKIAAVDRQPDLLNRVDVEELGGGLCRGTIGAREGRDHDRGDDWNTRCHDGLTSQTGSGRRPC